MKKLFSVTLLTTLLIFAIGLTQTAWAQNDVTVTATNVSPSSMPPGGVYKVIQLSFSGTSGSPVISNMNITRTGTAADGDVPFAVLSNGTTDLATANFTSGSGAFIYSFTPSDGLVLYIEFNVAGGANPTLTAGASMSSTDISGPGTTVTFSGITSGDKPLPVQSTDFLATADIGSVTLSWKTQSEVNNAGFNVLRQDPGSQSFLAIASYTSDESLKGLGTSTTGRTYSFTDMRVQSGATYQYMIQSVSSNGAKATFGSLPVTVKAPQSYALSQNYPNPFNPATTIGFDLKQTSTVTMSIFNILGQKVMELNYGTMSAGSYEKAISLDEFASGVYFYRITAAGANGENFVSMKKLVLMK